MQMRILIKSGLRVSEMGIGGWAMGGIDWNLNRKIYRPNYSELKEQPQYTVAINEDIGLRHRLIARKLHIMLDEEILQSWYANSRDTFQTMTTKYMQAHITRIDAQITQQSIREKIAEMRKVAHVQDIASFVISLDPAFCGEETADYLYQETRVSLLGPHHSRINIEQNPRSYANRFVRLAGKKNGAGKPLAYQLAEIETAIDTLGKKIHLILVDDFVNTGESLLKRFGRFAERRDVSLTVVAGVSNPRAIEKMKKHNVAVEPIVLLDKSINKYMDMSDFIPTLGGRVIGWSHEEQDSHLKKSVLRVTGGFSLQIPLAVDAIIGKYPWQVDLYLSDPNVAELLAKLPSFCLTTAWQFWDFLEQAKGFPITWKDLAPLQGHARVFYPVKDGQEPLISQEKIGYGPKQVIETLLYGN